MRKGGTSEEESFSREGTGFFKNRANSKVYPRKRNCIYLLRRRRIISCNDRCRTSGSCNGSGRKAGVKGTSKGVMATRGQNSRNQLCRIAEPGYRVSSGRKEAVFAVECFSKGRRLNNRPDAVNVL